MAEVDNWSTSAASNTTVAGINIAEGMARSDVNNAVRAVMAAVKEKFDDTTDAFVMPVTYGAVGDAVTNDSAAFVALQAAKPGRFVLGQGLTYQFATATSVPAGFKMHDGEIEHADTVAANDAWSVVGLGWDTLTANTFIPEQHPSSGDTYASGNHIVAIGGQALKANTTGRRQVAVGSRALLGNTTGYYNTAVGSHAMENNTTGHTNTACGVQALGSCTDGNNNTAVGSGACNKVTTGTYNVAVGVSACGANTSMTGNYNIGIGFQSGLYFTTCDDNIAIGRLSMQITTTGAGNVGLGTQALNLVETASFNVAVGYQALRVNTAASNVAVGANALDSNTSGARNTALGKNAGTANVTADDGTFIGHHAGLSATGATNTVVGSVSAATLTSGAGNTLVGYGADVSAAAAANQNAFGTSATCTADNQVQLGNGSISTFRCQVALTVVSDERDKVNLGPVPGLELVERLTPFRGSWDKRDGTVNPDGTYAFLGAQNVRDAEDALGIDLGLVDRSDPEKLMLTYERLIPVLVKTCQELAARIEALEAA